MTQRPDQTHPKRRRDAAATRSAILEAAYPTLRVPGLPVRRVREIAADAGVDAALVNRYFGSKAGSFAEVVERAFDLRYLIDGDRATLAERLARRMVYGPEDTADERPIPLLLMLRSATEPHAAELIGRAWTATSCGRSRSASTARRRGPGRDRRPLRCRDVRSP